MCFVSFYISVFQLNAAVQQYAWGKPGSNSTVAELARDGQTGFTVDTEAPYAEVRLSHKKMASISQTTFSDAISWIKIVIFWLKFH